MNKKELINEVKNAMGNTKVTKNEIGEIISSLFEVVTKTLADGGTVQLQGFGTFKTVKRSAREGRNPQNGEAIHIPERTVPHFKAGKAFKENIKNS